jgi:hypothetical protein
MLVFAGIAAPSAQEQFFTQSGGRGLQNAKTNARLSKVESDVDSLNVEMAKVKPHAKAELGACSDTAEKLRYDGVNWICEKETDPTVQAFAKSPLPTCSGNTILGVSGGQFSCVNSGFVSNETDPTVQAYAKAPLPSCSSQQVLTVQNGALTCMNDQLGVTVEKDPYVHDFARKDVVTALPNCATNETLTMIGGRLLCRVDSVGITAEVDPATADFARKDISGYSLGACASGEVLRTATSADNKVILECVAATDVISSSIGLGDLKDVTTVGAVSGSILSYDGTKWKPGSETDPSVEAWAKTAITACSAGKVITYNGTALTCVNPLDGVSNTLALDDLTDVAVGSVSGGQYLKYDGTTHAWVPGDVAEFAQSAPPTCGTGEILTSDGTNLSCVTDAGGSGSPLNLVELGDVRTSASVNLVPSDKDFLRWSSTDSKWKAVHDMLSATQTSGKWCYFDGTDVVCDRGGPSQCGAGDMIHWNAASSAFDCVSGTTALGLGTMAVQNADDVSITGGMINGTVIGNHTPDAGTFTNIVATGTVSGTFVGDGSGLTGISAGSLGASGITGSVQFKGVSGEISGTSNLVWNEAAGNLNVNGTVQVAGNGANPCAPAAKGTMRVVDIGAGEFKLQFCRP